MCLNRSTLVKKISQIWKTKFPYNFFRSNRNPTKCTELFFYVGEETSFSISVILAKIKKHSTACRKQRKTIFNRTERSLILERNKHTISGNFYLQLNNKNKLSFKINFAMQFTEKTAAQNRKNFFTWKFLTKSIH